MIELPTSRYREIGKEEEEEIEFEDDDDDDDSDSNAEPTVNVNAKPSMSEQKIIGRRTFTIIIQRLKHSMTEKVMKFEETVPHFITML